MDWGAGAGPGAAPTLPQPLPFRPPVAPGGAVPRKLQRMPRAQSWQLPLRAFPLGCCPRGWTLFRWKCLWASSERKRWKQSKLDCEGRSSRLLVLPKPWSARELWEAVGEAFTQVRKGRAESLGGGRMCSLHKIRLR